MRIYKNFKEATNEIQRDLAEMGILVHPRTVQNLVVENDPDYDTLELQDYIYRVLTPSPTDVYPTLPWAELEFAERMERIGKINPGGAWEYREEIWAPLINEHGRFDYTYQERFTLTGEHAFDLVIDTLSRDPFSRRAYIPI